MTKKLARLTTKKYIPGTPAVAPKPKYCYERTIQRASSGSVGSTSSLVYIPLDQVVSGTAYNGFLAPVYRQVEPYTDSLGGFVTQELIGYTGMRFSPNPTRTAGLYSARTETICRPAVPGVPGVPAQIVEQGAGPDWRASARSVETKSGDVTAAFDPSPSPRLIIGFASRDTGASQSDIRMGVVFTAAGVSTQIAPILEGVQQAPVGNYTNGDRVYLSRIGDRFYVQSGDTLLYSGAATTLEPVSLDAMLYTSNDTVDNPVLAAAVSTSVSGSLGFSAGLAPTSSVDMSIGLKSFIGSLVDGVAVSQVTGSLGFNVVAASVGTVRVAVSGSMGLNADARTGVVLPDGQLSVGGYYNSDLTSAALTIGPVVVRASDKPYAEFDMTLSRIQIEARGGESSQSVSGADVVLAPPIAYGLMQTGGLIDATLSLQPLKMLAADRDYGAAMMTLPRIQVYGDDGFGIPNYYGFNEAVDLTDSFFTDPALFASFYETLELEFALSLGTLVSGTVFEALILDPTTTVQDFLFALIEAGVDLSSATQLPDPSVAQYAFNALTGAATRYDGFNFTQFARAVGGVTYAVKPDGLYRLRPGDDAGAERSALVDFGTMSFGAQQRKNIETMYLGMTTDGTVYAKMKADGGRERAYRVIQREPTMRVRTGKGITAREWNLKLEVVDATRVDLDVVDFVVGASVRRWTR